MREFVLDPDQHLTMLLGDPVVISSTGYSFNTRTLSPIRANIPEVVFISVTQANDMFYYLDSVGNVWISDRHAGAMRKAEPTGQPLDTIWSHYGDLYYGSFAFSFMLDMSKPRKLLYADYRGGTSTDGTVAADTYVPGSWKRPVEDARGQNMIWGRVLPPSHRVVYLDAAHAVTRVDSNKWYVHDRDERSPIPRPVWTYEEPENVRLERALSLVVLPTGVNTFDGERIGSVPSHQEMQKWSLGARLLFAIGYRNHLIGVRGNAIVCLHSRGLVQSSSAASNGNIAAFYYDNGKLHRLLLNRNIEFQRRGVQYRGTDADNAAIFSEIADRPSEIWGRPIPADEVIVCVYNEIAITRRGFGELDYVIYRRRVGEGEASGRTDAAPEASGRAVAGPASAGDLGTAPDPAAVTAIMSFDGLSDTVRSLAAIAPEPEQYASLLERLAQLQRELDAAKARESRLQRAIDKSLADYECSVCLAAPVTHAFGPCGHLFCKDCVEVVQTCPKCRDSRKRVMRVFIPEPANPAQS